jgi:hypothetical protein
MISESTQAAIILGIAVIGGIAVDAPTLDQIVIDGTTLTAGGGGLAFALVARGLFKRMDEVLRMFRTIANGWLAHLQRVENLHRVALRDELQRPGVPEYADPGASTPLEIDLHTLEESQRIDLPKTEYASHTRSPKPFIRRSTRRG